MRPVELTPKDKDPRAGFGNTSQLLLADLARKTGGLPVFAESVEDLFAVLPFWITEKERDAGENDNVGGAVTVRVICNVALW